MLFMVKASKDFLRNIENDEIKAFTYGLTHHEDTKDAQKLLIQTAYERKFENNTTIYTALSAMNLALAKGIQASSDDYSRIGRPAYFS